MVGVEEPQSVQICRTSQVAERYWCMQKFRVLYLRHNKLEHSESLTGLDLLEVIEKASKRVPDLSAEIWSERGRVGGAT